ncbi:hypothetical protein I3843_09G208700 [Carya illinoinensis]|nr:hypothetical protein I3843_09G208700 [Carya illinoinensis]
MGVPLFSWLFFMMTLHSLFPSFCVYMAFGQCLGDQQSLLLQLKNNLVFNGTLSTKLVHWNESTDCCLWEGVTCSEGRVIGLDLSNEAISDGLDDSSSLFGLQYLQNLSLANNHFKYLQKEFPSELDRLTNLIYLNLSDAGFGGQIPIAISRLTSLVVLDLSTFYLPVLKLKNPTLNLLVRNLGELMELHLDGVNMSAQGNEWCQIISSSLPNLRVLSLSNCHLSGPFQSSLLKLQSLLIIRLDNNNLSTPMLEFFAKFKNLTSLSLTTSGLYDTFPKKVFQVSTLEILDLSNNPLLHGSLPDFPRNRSLRTLVLSKTNFSGILSDSVAMLTIMAKNLTEINLSHNHLTGQITSTHWEVLLSLVNLDLRNNSLDGSIPLSLFSLPSLEKLQLSNNQFSGQLHPFSDTSSLRIVDLSSDRLQGQLSILPNVATYLNFSRNNFSGVIPASIGRNKQSDNCTMDISCNVTERIHSYRVLFVSYSFLVKCQKVDTAFIGIFPAYFQEGKLHICTHRIILDCSTIAFCFEFWLLHWPNANAVWPIPEEIVIDVSYNNLEGTIPQEIGQINSLRVLNLSHNALTGQIQPSLGKLSPLISLDLSSNKLTGKIPENLIELTLLSTLNLSFNHLVGHIPRMRFHETSYEGNEGLCGFPLHEECKDSGSQLPNHSNNDIVVDWYIISAEFRFIYGLGIIILPNLFSKRWRIWYSQQLDDILSKIFPKLIS